MSRRLRKTTRHPGVTRGVAVARSGNAFVKLQRAHRLLGHLYEISKLFAGFENVEQTFDPALRIANQALPLRSAILIEAEGDRSRMIVWESEGQSSEQMRAGKAHVEAAYAYLAGAGSTQALQLNEQPGKSALPRQARTEGDVAGRFIVIPLVVAHRSPFGALQVEGARPLDETDLIFVSAIANQLAIALDRDGTWRRDITRRERAEQERTHAEKKGANAEQQRFIAESSREKYEALAAENSRLYEQARQAVLVRDQILSIVSHDLKNPLSTILMTTGELAKRGVPDEKRGGLPAAAGRIQRAAERMLRLIEDLLDYASIEAGRLAITLLPQDPGSMIHETVASFESVAQEKRLRLIGQVEPDLSTVACDRDRILQVLSNLVGNATKVTAQDGDVTLRVEARGQEVLFAVSDSGPGISEDDAKHLFERYWRSGAARYKGTGLGLSIARGIVNAHGGRIWVESELGHGATFLFTIPLTQSLPS